MIPPEVKYRHLNELPVKPQRTDVAKQEISSYIGGFELLDIASMEKQFKIVIPAQVAIQTVFKSQQDGFPI